MTILDPSHTFSSLAESIGLDVRLAKAVSRLGHVRPTLVQSKCLPLALSEGRDLLVRARTGSGKTLAYLLPAMQKIIHNPKPGVSTVVLVPTRELCTQVHQVLQTLTYYTDDIIKVAVLSVGKARGEKSRQDLERQEAMLRDQPNILVATPNGLLTHIRSGALNLKTSVETVVIDEADLILSFGYSDDISEIVKSLPRIYQGFLMSATLSSEVDTLKKIVLHSPVTLKLEQDDPNEKEGGKLKQFYIMLPNSDKNLVIYVFLKLGLLKGKGLFFVNSTNAGYQLKLFLEQFHIRSSVLNAELPFRSRINMIEQFNIGNFDYLIATDASADVGQTKRTTEDEDRNDASEAHNPKPKSKKDSEYGVSRGLDFRNVSFVVNVDFPVNSKSYAHRVGRTARGGAKGVAVSFVDAASDEQIAVLRSVQDEQPTVLVGGASAGNLQARPESLGSYGEPQQVQPQPVPLDFDLTQIEGFRYRVKDVERAVTKNAIREARANEIKMEILNSERLEGHFEENPADLQLLRHDRLATSVTHVQEHLSHVPKYLLPRGMQVASVSKKRKKRRVKGSCDGQVSSSKDPLQSFTGDATLDGVEGDDEEDPLTAEFMDDGMDEDDRENKKTKQEEPKIFANTRDGTGHSTARRQAWKRKHSKGAFSSKPRKSGRKPRAPLGI